MMRKVANCTRAGPALVPLLCYGRSDALRGGGIGSGARVSKELVAADRSFVHASPAGSRPDAAGPAHLITPPPRALSFLKLADLAIITAAFVLVSRMVPGRKTDVCRR